jgi:glucose/arabinose dehydrogenase
LAAVSQVNQRQWHFRLMDGLFVCLQTGQLRVIKNGPLLATPFLSLSVDSSGERGLLGIAFDPNFFTNHYVYVYYTVPTSPAHNRVSRFTRPAMSPHRELADAAEPGRRDYRLRTRSV